MSDTPNGTPCRLFVYTGENIELEIRIPQHINDDTIRDVKKWLTNLSRALENEVKIVYDKHKR